MVKKKSKTRSVKKTIVSKKVKRSSTKKSAKRKVKAIARPVRRLVLKKVTTKKHKVIKKKAVKPVKRIVTKIPLKHPAKPRISLAKQKKLQHYKQILLEKRRNVMEGIEKLRESAKGTESENISKYYDHPAEYGTDTMDREQYFLFISREEKYLLEIERSLEAIESGEYGTCRVCGKEIDEARLEAVPTTRICISCKMADQKARVSKTDLS